MCLPPVRAKAGLRDPTQHFTTNASESLNHIIKQEVNWKENKLPTCTLINHLRSIADRHIAELEKAVIGRGEWNFASQYSHLQVPKVSWFSRRSAVSRERHMKKVLSCQVASKSCGYSDKPPAPVSMPSTTTFVHKHTDAENHPPTPHSVLPEEPPAPVSMFSASIAAHKHADGENHPPLPIQCLKLLQETVE